MNVDSLDDSRYGTSSPLNMVWNDEDDPFGGGLDFAIREGENGGSTLDSELEKFSSEISLQSQDEDTSRSTNNVVVCSTRKKKQGQQAYGRRTRAKKPSGKPKRPLTAKMCFFEDLRAQEQRERGTIDFQTLRRIVDEKWPMLVADMRMQYEKQATDDMNRFKTEMQNYQGGGGKGKKAAAKQHSLGPARPSPSPETTPALTANSRLLDDLGLSTTKTHMGTPATRPVSATPVEKDTKTSRLRNAIPSTYQRIEASDVSPKQNGDFYRQAAAIRQPVQALPTPSLPPQSNPTPHFVQPNQYPNMENLTGRPDPGYPASFGQHRPSEGSDYLAPAPTRPTTEKHAPALLRPKMEVELAGPDGVVRRYILHYRCITMKRSDVPAFMDSLSPGAPGGVPQLDRSPSNKNA